MPKGTDPGQSGVKKGYPNGISRHNSTIEDNVFSKDWASPLNADNAGMPGPSPKQGGILSDVDTMDMPNPLGIPNVGTSEKRRKK